MSCYGTRRTPLFEANVAHVISMDDFGGPPNPLVSYVDVFVRIYRREFTLRLGKPHRKFFVNRYGDGNIPRLFGFHAATDQYEAHQYDGDYHDGMADDPYYGQTPK